MEGIRFVRRVTRKLRECGLVASEEVPGDEVVDDAGAGGIRAAERLGPPRVRHLSDRRRRRRTAS